MKDMVNDARKYASESGNGEVYLRRLDIGES
jgi:hypothetical protein